MYDGMTDSSAVPTITSGSLAYSDTATWSETYDNRNVGTAHVMTAAGTVSDGNLGKNYMVKFLPATGPSVITAAPLTITAATNTKGYDTTVSAAALPMATGLQTGDTITAVETYSTATAGTGKTLNVSPGYTVNDGNGGKNYSLPMLVSNTTGVINQAGVMATIVASSKPYDTTTAALITGCSLSGVLGTDAVTCSATGGAFSSPNAGTWPVLATVTLAGSASGNCMLSPSNIAGTTAVIAPLTISASITANNKDFDGTNTATVTCTPVGVLGSDNVTCSAAGATFSSSGPGSLTVTATGITLGGSSAMNYALASTTAMTTVPATISESINLSALSLNGTELRIQYDAFSEAWTGTALQLTNARTKTASAWLSTAIPVSSAFMTTFQFQITPAENGANSIGDGFAFVIQGASSGNATLGTTGAAPHRICRHSEQHRDRIRHLL